MGPINLTGEMLAGPRRIPDIDSNGGFPMTDSTGDEFFAKAVRQQRLIVLALLGGSMMFIVAISVAHFVALKGKPVSPDLPNLALVAVAVAGGALASSFLVPESLRKQAVERQSAAAATPADDTSALLVGWQTTILIRTAMFEGAAVLSAILFLLTADFAALGIAIAMIGMIAMGLPSEMTARRWLDRSLEELERKRGGATDSI